MKILIDTREKIPWRFAFADVETELCTEKTGDYTIEGFETVICLDRKKSVDELARNLCSDYERFRKELVRMMDFKYAYFICEFSLEDILNYPNKSGADKYTWRNKQKWQPKTTGKKMLKQIETIENKYGVKFIFAGNRLEAEQTAYNIFLNVYQST